MTGLITLDLSSSNVGWTAGELSAVPPRFGTQAFPKVGNDLGELATIYHKWLVDLIKQFEPKRLVFEQPILPRETNIMTMRKLGGLAWHTEFVCKVLNIGIKEAHVSTVKKFWAQHGFAKKEQMVAAARDYGFDVETHDEADALAVRYFTIATEHPQVAAEWTGKMQILRGLHV